MVYWAACRLQPNRTALALHFLNLQGYEVYCPRLRELRVLRGRRAEVLGAIVSQLYLPEGRDGMVAGALGAWDVRLGDGWYSTGKGPRRR